MTTPPMTPERWARIEAVLDEALERPASERDAFVASACAGDDALRAEVARLLAAAADDAEGPLPSSPEGAAAAAFAAPLVARTLGDDTDGGASAPRERHPARVGPWRVLAPAGEGGMGTVYVVERDDGAFHMKAALKVVRRGLDLDDAFVRRFREERQILAGLTHPNIARLLDGGMSLDGQLFYVMEYVDGAPIDQWCDARALGVDARLALFAKVCDAVAAAHARGVVHRDLKPSNVLVTAQGEPKLLDFGIAKTLAPVRGTGEWATRTGEDGAPPPRTALTRTGERLLTPEYASPEQVRGDTVTAATDVYALGILLCELLTGVRPFVRPGRGRHDIERAILEEAPPRPSAVAPEARRRRLRGDLDAIVLTALRKEPGRRYASAAALADDVRRALEGRTVQARGDSAAYRARAWIRRNRRVVAAGALGVVLGVGALAVVLARDDAPARRDGGAPAALAQRYEDDGMRAFARGNWTDATRLLQAALELDSTRVRAAIYASDAASRDEDYETRDRFYEQAVRMAPLARERDRLEVRAYEAFRHRTPLLAVYADSLLTRFPADIEGDFYAARASFMMGDFADARIHYARVIARDSSSITTGRAPCLACEALLQVPIAYIYDDSLEAAERTAREFTRRMPDAANAWRALAMVHLYKGDDDEDAFRRTVSFDPAGADYAAEWLADRNIRRADFAAADEVLRGRMQTAPAGREERSMGLLIVSLRNQERWDDALALAQRYRALFASSLPAGVAHAAAMQQAQVLLERGAARASAALFDSVSRWSSSEQVPSISHRVWHLAHRADALVSAGDTSELTAIADTIRALAPQSGYGRDRKLEFHVRGLLLQARGDHGGAVGEFRRAVWSWPMGYTRTNLALARSLLALGRPAEAVAALQPALRGGLEVNNAYVTHTTLHRALAEAWRATGNADSAAFHDRWVARATRRR